jgi:ribokinase
MAKQQEKRWDIVVVGGAYTDYVVRGPRLPKPAETIQGKDFLIAPGSKGSNQAVAAARLGARVSLVAKVGRDDRGDNIIEKLKEEGVDSHGVVRDAQSPTGISLIQVDEHGQKQMMISSSASQQLTKAEVEQVADTIRSAKMLMTQLEIPLDAAQEAIRIAHEAGMQVLLDPAPPMKLSDDLFLKVDVIKPDTKEAETITGVHVQDRATAKQAAEKLLQKGVKVVAVQAGDSGDLLVWQNGECWLPRIPVHSIDATGAGDAFAAALAVALVEGQPLQEAGLFASATAALATTKLGGRPSLPRRNEVDNLLKRSRTS